MYAKFHHNIPLSSRHRTIFTFSEFVLGKAATDDKCHFAISWARSCQYQCVCKSSSKYSKWFTSYRHFSRTVRAQNLQRQSGDKIFTLKLSGDKIKCLIIGHTPSASFDFLMVVQSILHARMAKLDSKDYGSQHF